MKKLIAGAILLGASSIAFAQPGCGVGARCLVSYFVMTLMLSLVLVLLEVFRPVASYRDYR
jgi:hypothetical protein